jgi:tetratricopeptide (TPR) repeat protein
MPRVIGGGAATEAQRKANRAEVAKEFGLPPEELERWLATFSSKEPYDLGLIALLNGRYTEAATLLSQALEAAGSKQNGASQKVVNAGLFLGHANYLLGNYTDAAQAYRRAAELVPQDAGLLNSLALALDRAKDTSGAESLLRRIVGIKEEEIRKKVSEPDSEELAASLTNLGRILTEKNKCAEAEPLLLRALPIWERKLSPADRNLATAYRNVAMVVYCGGDNARAGEYFAKEAGVYERIFGVEHPEYAAVLNDYAMKMYYAREYAVAEPLLKRCLAIWRKQVGGRGSGTIRTLRVLGDIRAAAKDYGAAEDFYTEALTAREAESGPENPALVEILYELDAVYQQQKNWAKAERALRQIVRIRQKQSPQGRNFATALSNLASLLYNREDYHNAEKYFQEALPLLEKHLGPDDPDVRFVRRALDSIRKITGGKPS